MTHRMTTPSDIVASVDIGCSKVSVLIARRDADGTFAPLGVGQQSMRRGSASITIDLEAGARSLAVAADQAMRMAGVAIHEVAVTYGGPGMTSVSGRAAVTIGAGGVTERTTDAALQAAIRTGLRKGQRVLSVCSARYAVDDGEFIVDPLRRMGAALTCEITMIVAPEAALSALELCCRRAGLAAISIHAAPLAAGEGVLTAEERAAGVFIIDLGAAQSSFAAYVDGAPFQVSTTPIGGDLVTEALAAALGTTKAAGERLKIAHSDLSDSADPRAVVEVAQICADGRLAQSVAARGAMDVAVRTAWMSIFAALREALDAVDPAGALPVVLTGGGAMTAGVIALAERALGRRVRIGAPRGFGVLDKAEGGPGFAVGCGAMRSGAANAASTTPAMRRAVRSQAPVLRVRVGRAWEWLRENL